MKRNAGNSSHKFRRIWFGWLRGLKIFLLFARQYLKVRFYILEKNLFPSLSNQKAWFC